MNSRSFSLARHSLGEGGGLPRENGVLTSRHSDSQAFVGAATKTRKRFMTYNEMTAFFANRTKKAADRDIAGIVADYAEDCVLESPTAGRVVGRAAVEQYLLQYTGARAIG